MAADLEDGEVILRDDGGGHGDHEGLAVTILTNLVDGGESGAGIVRQVLVAALPGIRWRGKKATF